MSPSLYLNCFITFLYVHTCKTAEHCVKGNRKVSLENFSAAPFFARAISAGLSCKNTVVKNKKATDKIIHLLLTLSL